MASAERAVPRRLDEFTWPSPEVNECPFAFYAALREEAPVYQPPGREEYIVSRWQDIAYVSEHPEIFGIAQLFDNPNEGDVGEPLTRNPMSGTNPPEHSRKRSLTKEFVARDRLAIYEPKIRAIANQLIDAFIERGAVEFYEEFSDHLPTLVIVDILGLPDTPEDIARYQRWNDSDGTSTIFSTPERRAYLESLRDEALAFMRDQVEQRLAQPREDFLSEFVALQVERDGAPACEFLAEQAFQLLFAGNLTTTHVMSSAMLLLLQNPDQMARVHGTPKLLRSALEETVRLECPVQFLNRVARTEAQVGGVAIPKGAKILIMLASGNRDETAIDDPERFLVGRPGVSKTNLGFGRGIHRCLGAPLARLEMEVAFETLLDRLHNISLAASNTYQHLGHSTFRAVRPLNLEFEPGKGLASLNGRTSTARAT